MTIHELEPRLCIGPIKIGSRLGPEVRSFPKEVGELFATFRRGPIVLDSDRDLYEEKVSVTVVSPHEVILDNNPALSLSRDQINEVPGLKRKLRWTPA